MVHLCLTGLLTGCVAYRQLKYGAVRAMVMGTGFFAVAFYLDSIFSLIMGSAVQAGTAGGAGAVLPDRAGLEAAMQLAGLVISKSILGIVLGAAAVTGVDRAWAEWDSEGDDGENFLGQLMSETNPHTEKLRNRWQYMDVLTIGISLFFIFLLLDQFYFYRHLLSGYHLSEDIITPGIAYVREENDSAAVFMFRAAGRADFFLAIRLVFFLTLLLAYYVSAVFYRKRQHARKLQQECRSQKQEAALYLKNVESQYQRTRELWHDLKNHISYLSLLLRGQKYAEMSNYLRIFADDVDSLSLPVKSGNPVVDALLADKSARAKKEGISVELSLCDLTGLPLKPDEICGLLGNLLDNALEANQLLEEGRFLAVESKNRGTWYYIKVANAAGNGSHAPKTDRRNQVGHGLGLRSVERIVHRCGGELEMEHRDGRFTVVVRLPGQPG